MASHLPHPHLCGLDVRVLDQDSFVGNNRVPEGVSRDESLTYQPRMPLCRLNRSGH